MDDIGLDAHERTGEPEYDPYWDNERMSAAMYGGWSWREQQYGGANWPRGECLPMDGDGGSPGREDVGRD